MTLTKTSKNWKVKQDKDKLWHAQYKGISRVTSRDEATIREYVATQIEYERR
jgi:hypothetical protein